MWKPTGRYYARRGIALGRIYQVEVKKLSDYGLNLYQRLKARIGIPIYLEHRTYPGWSGALPFYILYCDKHGYYADYPHGYKEYFLCPYCWNERNPEYPIDLTRSYEVVENA